MQPRAKTTAARRGMKPAATRRATKPKAQRTIKTASRRAKPAVARERSRTQSQSRTKSAPQKRAQGGRTALSAQSTTDLKKIQRWVESRQGWPATVASTSRGKGAGILRIDFPGFSGKGSLKRVSWEEWYKTFQDRNLTFLYQDRTATGKPSRFFKLVCRPKK